MKNKTRRTEILIETHELTIIRANKKSLTVWCDWCQKAVAAFMPEQITFALRFSSAEIKELSRTGQIHSINTNNELLCGDSLANYFTN